MYTVVYTANDELSHAWVEEMHRSPRRPRLRCELIQSDSNTSTSRTRQDGRHRSRFQKRQRFISARANGTVFDRQRGVCHSFVEKCPLTNHDVWWDAEALLSARFVSV